MIQKQQGGARKVKIHTDLSMAGTKHNAFGFRSAVFAGTNLRNEIDFSNCVPLKIQSLLQGSRSFYW